MVLSAVFVPNIVTVKFQDTFVYCLFDETLLYALRYIEVILYFVIPKNRIFNKFLST